MMQVLFSQFSKILREETAGQESKLKHIHHTEELMVHDGEPGFHHSLDALHHAHEFLTTGHSEANITTKYDGSPSVIFGHHPTTGRFFVASKSAFNEAPKINYTPEDIDKNHGHAPGLAVKLKQALRHLPKVAPKHGTYQGDIMYGEGDVVASNGQHNFTPNTITYSADEDSPEGEKIAKSKFGIVVHTKYNNSIFSPKSGTGISFNPDTHNFNHHPDVNLIDHKVDNTFLGHTPHNEIMYQNNISAAKRAYKEAPHDTFNSIEPHKEHISTYVNDTVKNETEPSVPGYKNFLRYKYGKTIDKLKRAQSKFGKQKELDAHIQNVEENNPQFESFFKIHNHVQKAKNALVDSLSRSQTKFNHSVGGTPTNPEGFVIQNKGILSKLVNRKEFSRLNFLKSKNR
jgi:hypothetical protein